MPVTSGPVISYVGEFGYGETQLIRVAPVPLVDYVDAVKQLVGAKTGSRVPVLIRARLGYDVVLRDYEPWPSLPGYCPAHVIITGVDWRGQEYQAVSTIVSPDNREARGSVDLTEHYRLPPLMLTPWRIGVSVLCRRAVLEIDATLYVEWGW